MNSKKTKKKDRLRVMLQIEIKRGTEPENYFGID